jgi:short-subunit dehydrogenase
VNATILITGATDGIGLDLARLYQKMGARLVLVGRRPLEELDADFFNETNYCCADLSLEDAADRVLQFLDSKGILTLDLLVQNAGIGYVGSVGDQSDTSIRQLMAVNLQSPIALTHALLPRLRPAKGKIVFVSSVAAVLPTAEYAVYTATKAALDGFARNLRIELQKGIAIQVIHVGATRTGMLRKAGGDLTKLKWDRFAPPEQVASQIAKAIQSRHAQVTIGLPNKIVYFAARWLAPLVDWLLVRVRR